MPPKHLILFGAFMALLVGLFYHPVPNPDLWDADARHIDLPKYPHLEQEKLNVLSKQNLASWPERLETVFDNHRKMDALSSLQ